MEDQGYNHVGRLKPASMDFTKHKFDLADKLVICDIQDLKPVCPDPENARPTGTGINEENLDVSDMAPEVHRGNPIDSIKDN